MNYYTKLYTKLFSNGLNNNYSPNHEISTRPDSHYEGAHIPKESTLQLTNQINRTPWGLPQRSGLRSWGFDQLSGATVNMDSIKSKTYRAEQISFHFK